jgi:hypothetical protein
MVEKFSVDNHWFNIGIPSASLTAPWQTPNLKTTTMYPDVSGTIDYSLNSLGYRDKEWSDWDLDNSVWCIGNSDTFGTGIQQSETWVKQLESVAPYKTVNLGINGASWDTISRVISSGLRDRLPQAIIIQATTPDRREYISNDLQQIVLPSLPEDMFSDQMFWKYVDDENSRYNIEKNLALIDCACRAAKIKYFIFSINNRWDLVKQDPAADHQHLGAATHLEIARQLLKEVSRRSIWP